VTKPRKPRPKDEQIPVQALESLAPDQLRKKCAPESLGFKSTDDLPRLAEVIGQPRAFRALELGVEVAGPGYNIFTLGLPGSGKTTLVREYLERRASGESVPDDWCYVNNFLDARSPLALRLPAGRGEEFRKDMRTLITRCREEITRTLESEPYQRERAKLTHAQEKSTAALIDALNKKVEQSHFLLAQTPYGFMLVPAVGGKPLKPEELEGLSDKQKEKLRKLEAQLQNEVKATLVKIRDLAEETRKKIDELDAKATLFAIGHLMDELKGRYAGLEEVVAYLEHVQADILANIELFRPQGGQRIPSTEGPSAADPFRRYEVNIIVDRAGQEGAPVVVENHPTYHNLLGRVEREMIMGATRTDFTMIRGGALHRANGGYLILPARDVLLNPYAWEGLKRCLKDRSIRLTDPISDLGLVSTITLEPEPVPLEVKVILIGTPLLYYLLRANDEDFEKLFKVRAEFATLIDRTPETEHEYALFVKAVVEDNRLPAFDSNAVARIIEHGSRLAEHQGRLSARLGMIADLIRESAYWAAQMGRKRVDDNAVERAVQEQIFRSNLSEEYLQEMLKEGSLLIEVEGQAIGKANALSVIDLGDYAFGRPTRVTATVQPGREGVIDIERESKLGGRIHTKGVLILSGLLAGLYGQKGPLTMSASLTFEQSYAEIEGDSASVAELLALLSALGRVPLRQDCAITGSINQYGEIQPVGGINEKIEGFFETCQHKGLTGTQGVLIPAANQRNLMLHQKVISAVEEGKFQIWPMSSLDDGIRLLTGLEPGVRDVDGEYPDGSFHALVQARLRTFAESLQPPPEEEQGSS